MAKAKSKLPKSRTASLLSMAAKVALKEGQTLFRNQAEKRLSKMLEQADIIVDHVGRLKGAAMKAVQMITIEAQDILPPEVLKILEKLQSQAPPIPDHIMFEFLKSELGEDRFGLLKNISKSPIAAASIGQVYSAEVNSEPVVVKVQYPGISDSIDSDLSTLKKLLRSLLFISGKDINIDELFSEIKRVLEMETDYLQEAASLETYSKLFNSETDYIIPKVFHHFTTPRVIVLSKEEGLEFVKWVHTDPDEAAKMKVGQLLLDLYIKEFFVNNLVQTDPNPANFLINKSNQLVLLDFGATLNYPKEFVGEYQKLLQTVFSENHSDIIREIVNLNFLSEKESDETKKAFMDFLIYSLIPFDEKNQPFDFKELEYNNEIRKRAINFSKKIKYSAPPKQIIFLHRKLGGIFQLLRRLQIKVDLSGFSKLILENNFD